MKLLRNMRSFDKSVQLLFLNQLTINIGFYMLMPYLATHLADDLGLAVWLVGLILGVRNLCQQGMFLIGGTIADRLGYKAPIVAGCLLRTVGFAMLGLTDSVPALVLGAALTGLAGALFNPAVRAYVAADAGERRVEAFALFNVFYQAGILVGPLIGLLLTGITFRLTCLVAAAVFAMLTVVQVRALPARQLTLDGGEASRTIVGDWRQVFGNRRFLAFTVAMIGSYVLSFQVYLALPLELRRVASSDQAGTLAVGAMFAVSAILAIVYQVRITEWCKNRWTTGQSLSRGLALMGLSFVPLWFASSLGPTSSAEPLAQVLALLPALACSVLLTLGTLVVYPFEMDTVVRLAGGQRLLGTHYGLYNSAAGIGITLGNLLTGAALETSAAEGHPALPWICLTVLGLVGAVLLARLWRRLGDAGGPVRDSSTSSVR